MGISLVILCNLVNPYQLHIYVSLLGRMLATFAVVVVAHVDWVKLYLQTAAADGPVYPRGDM
jgi:hypothetical protein